MLENWDVGNDLQLGEVCVFNFMMHNKLSFWTDKYFLFSEKGFGLNWGGGEISQKN